jgi:nucleotide-binding universal stress UspA family protein
VLLAYDGSAPSTRALGFALRLVRGTGGRIWAVHAASAPATVAEPRTDEEQRREVDAIGQALSDARARAVAEGIPFEIWLREGPAPQVLLAAAAEIDAELLVVGTRGLRGAARLLLGSVSSAVIAHARCPVLVVP